MKLAIKGGAPIRSKDYPKWPQYGREEESLLMESLHQGQWWRVHGKQNVLFEKEFAEIHGCEHALAVNSGTSALEIALFAADVGPGDEVIVPAFTFISTSMAVQKIGAIPIPVDVLPDTYCICPKAVKNAITSKTKAMIPVHMSGHFCDMEALVKIADESSIVIIQDAAHAHGARGENGKAVGEWGSMACFSFQNFKLMTAGEGGMILFPNEELREKAFEYSNCGRPLNDRAYQHNVVGINARLSEFSAGVLRAQLQRLEKQTEVREINAEILRGALENTVGIDVQQRTSHAVNHPHYMFMFTLNDNNGAAEIDRNYFVDCLIAEGIPAFRAYQALYRIPCFWHDPHPDETKEDYINSCPTTEHIASRGIWIHHRALLGTKDDAKDVAMAINKVLAG